MPAVIGITGGSGVGKSFLSKAIERFFGEDNCLIMSTDDLHRWPRHDTNWENYTHLDPVANDIELGFTHLHMLKNGNPISRRIYDHSTGNHTKPIEILPKRYIIHEGLHAFYDKLKGLCDIRIYVETTDTLKKHWKICRDIAKRQYTKDQVISSIEKRKPDYEKFLLPQKNHADLVVYLYEENSIKDLGNLKENIRIKAKFFIDSNSDCKLLEKIITFIKKDIEGLNDFIYYSRKIGKDPDLNVHSGGNTSFKYSSNRLYIKSSGSKLSEMDHTSGYICLDNFKLKKFCAENINISDSIIGDKVFFERFSNFQTKPSMEYGFHCLLDDNVVIHTHPVYLSVILCIENAEQTIEKLYSNLDYGYIPYSAPGFQLTKQIMQTSRTKKIFFLQNHGLIVSGNNMQKSYEITKNINKTAMEYLINYSEDFTRFEDYNPELKNQKVKDLFPDSVVFSDRMPPDLYRYSLYIRKFAFIINQPRYLSKDEVRYIKSMQFENYRKFI